MINYLYRELVVAAKMYFEPLKWWQTYVVVGVLTIILLVLGYRP